jgi:hypothetical protein
MGLLRELAMLPMAPFRLATWTVDRVIDAAEREHYGPDAVTAELIELSRQLDEGLISPEVFDAREDELLDRLAEGQRRGFGG